MADTAQVRVDIDGAGRPACSAADTQVRRRLWRRPAPG
jgi:hypothetical protein